MMNGDGAVVQPQFAAAAHPARRAASRFAVVRGLSRDTCIKLILTAGLVVLTSVLVVRLQLEFPLADLVKPLASLSLLIACTLYYRRRGEVRFVLCFASLAQLLAFVAGYTVLMYVMATAAAPLADAPLAAFDAACGVEVPALRAWAAAHPFTEVLLNLAYDTVLYQLALIVIILGLLGDRRPLESFVLQFALAALFTLVVFRFLPAEGPFSTYGFEPSSSQAHYLDHLRTLRNGERRLVSFEGAEGLITFPSFHVTWAMLLTLGYRHRRWLFVPFALLNALVVVSTMTTGWHYFADVLGGLTVGLAAWGVSAALGRWLYARDAV
jgi:membrane-associated phospholipid phosphatase